MEFLFYIKYNNIHNIFVELFSYSFQRLYLDEINKEGYLNTDDEIIFKIDTASKLPSFPIVYYNIIPKKINSPYIPLNISKKLYKVDSNIYSILDEDGDINITTLSKFVSRMNIFITGDMFFNIFNDINYKENKMAICGSIMSACLTDNNPLRKKFNSDFRYYSEYYSNSDLDIMIKTQDHFEFLNICNNITEKIQVNLIKRYNNCNLESKLIKNIYVYYKRILEKKIINKHFPQLSIENVIENIDNQDISKILPIIENEHNKYIDNISSMYNDDGDMII